MSTKATFRTKKTTTQWVSNNIDLILELPAPSQEYRFENVVRNSEQFENVRDDLDMDFLYTFTKLRDKGAIKKLRYYYDEEESNGYHIWETSKEIYEYAKAKREERETYPCTHSSGFRTIDPENNIYECGYEFCEETYPRRVVEAIEF